MWLRNDLRLHDNPAMEAGIRRGEPLVIVYVHDEVSPGMRPLGSATKWWLHHSLGALSDQIRSMGGELVLRQGSGPGVIHELVNDLGAGAVFWNRRYGTARELDATLKDDLRSQGLMAESFAGNLLFEPWTIKNGEGNLFRVFTPFWRVHLPGNHPAPPTPHPPP